jgi:uncharacterized protein YecE (DUF72 family)
MVLFIGTSGWAYKEWKPAFYPADLPQKSFLEHYGTRLTACEINATFYRTQAEATLDKWSSTTPEAFRFSLKAHRGLSYAKTLAPDERRTTFLREFVDGVSRLGPKLGAILFQAHPRRKRADEDLQGLLDALPDHAPPFAFDLGDDSWDSDEVRTLIGEEGNTVCLSERDGKVPETLPPGPIAYVRMRAPDYSPAARRGWLELLQHEAQSRDVFVFSKHEGTAADDPAGGVGLSVWLREAAIEGSDA